MNCCLWIIVLLACRGNGGTCQGSHARMGSCENRGNDCMTVPFCARRQNEDDERRMCCEPDDSRMERREAEECGCMRNGNPVRMQEDSVGCNEQRMSYETFGCQENGIPCPPPGPGNFMR